MANIILKLIPNKWDAKYHFSFIKANAKNPKDRHYLAYNTFKHDIRAGDFWECFIHGRRETAKRVLFKVVPFRKIDPTRVKEEIRRVLRFNKELDVMEKLVGVDFEKIIFKRDNLPFLQARRDAREELARKYPQLVFVRENEGLLARPSERLFQRQDRRPRGGRPFQRPSFRSFR